MLCISREELFVVQRRQCFLSHRTGNPLRGAEYSCDLALEGSSFQNSWVINGEELVSSKGDSEQGTNTCAMNCPLGWMSLLVRLVVD